MAGPKTESNGQIVPRQAQPEVIVLLDKMKGEFAKALPRHLTTDRMMRVCLTALRQTKGLIDCSVPSILGSMLSAAQLGLEPNTPLGFAYLVPYKRVAQLIIGYKGYLDIARRSGQVAGIQAHVVRDGDEFDFQYGLRPDVVHKPSKDPDRIQRDITHVYAVAQLKDKESLPIFVVLSMNEVTRRRNRSAARGDGPWVTDLEAMIEKTAIRALAKWLPMSVEFATGLALDDTHDRGQSQVEQWNPDVVDALKREGLVVDTIAETPEPDPEQAAQPAQTNGNGKQAREPGQEG